jgi:hypothetical protein
MSAQQLIRRRAGRWFAGAIQTGTLAVLREIRMPDVSIAHVLSCNRKNSVIGHSSCNRFLQSLEPPPLLQKLTSSAVLWVNRSSLKSTIVKLQVLHRTDTRKVLVPLHALW